MTGDQLKALREARNLTREQLATALGDCSQSTINKWERNINPVPDWVEEKMLSNVQIHFPLNDLHALLDYSRESGESFEDFLSAAVREYIANHRSKSQPQTVNAGPTHPTKPFNMPQISQQIAADQDDDTKDISPPVRVRYPSGKTQSKKEA